MLSGGKFVSVSNEPPYSLTVNPVNSSSVDALTCGPIASVVSTLVDMTTFDIIISSLEVTLIVTLLINCSVLSAGL